MIQPENKTEDLLLSLGKKCQTLMEQAHRKPQEILEFKSYKSRECFSFKPSLIFGLDSNCMIGSTSLQV